MGMGDIPTPKLPPPAPLPPDQADQHVRAARAASIQQQTQTSNRKKTLLTGAFGDTTTPKTLLGQ